MAAVANGMKVVVQNTFVNAVYDFEDDDHEELFRTCSDPSGGRTSKKQTTLLHVPSLAAVQDESVSSEEKLQADHGSVDAVPSMDQEQEAFSHLMPATPIGTPVGTPLASPRGFATMPVAADSIVIGNTLACMHPAFTQPAPMNFFAGATGPLVSAGTMVSSGHVVAQDPTLVHHTFGFANPSGAGTSSGRFTDDSLAHQVAGNPTATCAVQGPYPTAPYLAMSTSATTTPTAPLVSVESTSAVALGTVPAPILSMTHPLVIGMTMCGVSGSGMAPVASAPAMSAAVPANFGAGTGPALIPFTTMGPFVNAPPETAAMASGVASAVPRPLVGQDWGLDPFGCSAQRFHEEVTQTGALSADGRQFTKHNFAGLLSVITEDQVHARGVLRYSLQFTEGRLSSADGVGFILSPKLPCSKNIQRIVSIFVNRSGRICIRAHHEVIRCHAEVEPLEIGDWVTLEVDMDKQQAKFAVWPSVGGAPSTAELCFGEALQGVRRKVPNLPKCLSRGYFACVIKNPGVTVRLGC